MRKKNFNPRSREGSDCDRVGRFREVCKFQSTLPRGERRFAICSPSLILGISIHAPARGATSTYQHTHYSTRISIHAPARGATDFSDFFKFFLRISIHAPARGATVDPFFGSLDHVISIHAPARGATFGTLRSIPAASLFQSTLPRGERLLCGANLKLVIQFQSTLPRGERHSASVSSDLHSAFQSTLPRGERRIINQYIIMSLVISIHAPARGATHSVAFSVFSLPFQSTLPRGERQNLSDCCFYFLEFQSTLPRGERPGSCWIT